MKTTEDDAVPGHARKCQAELTAEIAVREGEISQLRAGQAALRELYGDAPAAAPECVQTTGKKKKGGGRGKANRQVCPTKETPAGDGPADGVSVAPQGRPPTADYVKLMAEARKCPEPFTAASLAVATGLETKFCANKLYKWKGRGFLEKAGYGEFKRTKDFPQSAEIE